MQPTISVDLSKAVLRFSDAGIPEQVRTNLRRLIPGLAHNITAAINNRINSQLKTRRTITVTQKMREDPRRIVMEIAIESPSAEGLLPTYLELGTKAHQISPRNAYARFFTPGFWGWTTYTKLKPVQHPGTRAYNFLGDTVSEFKNDIHATLDEAVKGL